MLEVFRFDELEDRGYFLQSLSDFAFKPNPKPGLKS